MMWMWGIAGAATGTQWCTDLGPLSIVRDAGGGWHGTMSHRWDVSGDATALSVVDAGIVLFEGPLEDLHPTATGPSPAAVARILAEATPNWSATGRRVIGDGFVGEVDSEGILRGSGRRSSEVWALDAEGIPFGGPMDSEADIAEVHRRYGTGAASLRAVVGNHAARVGAPAACPIGGASGFRVGMWPHRMALAPGQRVVWTSANQATLRDPRGRATVYTAVPMDRALAASVADELRQHAPGARRGVGWDAGIALIVVSDDPLAEIPDPLAPRGGAPAVLWMLEADLPAAGAPRPFVPALEAGAEAVAALNQWRSDAGLAPLRWDEDLALSALQHASYLSLNGIGARNHRQEPGQPLFLGEDPQARGGGRELVVSSYPGRRPAEAIVDWITAPFHRAAALHPLAHGIGIATVGGIWVAELDQAPGVAPTAWPPTGTVVPARAFVGREHPDPLPLHRYPDRIWPVGFPVTVWTVDKLVDYRMYNSNKEVDTWIVREPLGGAREARHLVPKLPLVPGASYRYVASTEDAAGQHLSFGGTFRAPDDPGNREVTLPPALAAVVAAANTQRDVPLRATVRAAATSRLASAVTRAMREGLDPALVRRLLGGIGEGAQIVAQVCYRPDDRLELDAGMLDPGVGQIGVDPQAVTVTWTTDRSGVAVPNLRWPRVCVYLLP